MGHLINRMDVVIERVLKDSLTDFARKVEAARCIRWCEVRPVRRNVSGHAHKNGVTMTGFRPVISELAHEVERGTLINGKVTA